ncbi:retrotransposon ORF1 [Tanacetum coccineum]
MDLNSSLGKICLGEDVFVISSDKVEGSGDRNSPEFQDTANNRQKKETKAMVFYQMDTEEVSDRFVAPCFVNGLEAYDGEINLGVEENMISNEYAVKLCLEHEVRRGNKVVKKELIVALRGEIYFVKFIIIPEEDDVEPGLDGKIVKEEEEEVKRIKGEALKEKDDPEAFIFPIRLEGQVNKNALANTGSDINTMPYRIYEQLGREDMKKVDKGITMINYTREEAMGILTNVLCQVGVTTLIAKFLILYIPIDCDSSIVVGRGFLRTIGSIVNTLERLFSIFYGFCHQTFRTARSDVMRNTESDSDDEEDYQIKRNKFGAPVYGPKPAPYLNCNDPADRSLAIQTVTNLFQKISVWKKAVSFLGSLPVPLKNVNWKPDYKGSYNKEEEATWQWQTEIRMDCDGEINDMLRIRLREVGSDEEVFTSVAWIRAFNINEPIYAELCHEFYSTYEFDEVCADDELQTKKIIKFRLGGRAHSLTLLEFARRLGLYQAVKLEEEGFNVYIEGDMDTTTLRDLIDSDGKLIPEDPQPGVPRVGIPRPPRASMQDLYDRIGRMEICQEAIEQMEYMQSFTGTGTGECLSIWLGFTVFQYREPTTHLVMLSRSMTNIISSTHLHHHSIHHSTSSNNRMMMSSVETTQTEEVSDRFVAPCFVNGLEVYDGEINLGVEENMISNEYAVKLCLEHEVKGRNKVVKKELIVALRDEIYFVKLIINPEKDDVEPGVIFGRSFMTKEITDFGDGTIIIYPDIDPFLEETEEEEKSNDDWDHLLDFNIDDIPLLGEEGLPSFVDLDGKIIKEEEEAVKIIKGEALKEKYDPGAFIFPIGLEGHVNENALADTGSDINTMPFRIYVQLGREDMKKTMGTHDDEAGSSRSKHSRQHETIEEVLLPQVHHEFLLWEGCNRDAKSRMDCDGKIDDMLRIRLREAGSDEEIFTSVAWISAFNINEPIYVELCLEFYSNYEFDKVCADDELQSKKIIKFRLGGRAHSLTLLEFARRLGLYQAVKLEEEGFNVYFEGGLRSDEHFNAQDYWLSIIREENLDLSRSHTSTIKKPFLRVIHKMITYGLCQRTTGYDKIQKNDLWLLSMFDARHQNGVLTEDVVRSLSAPIYCRDLDMITLRDLIDFDGKLIPEDPQPGVPRVGIPRPPRASMQDLYDRMGRMEICQEAIERMEYRQSYH